MLTADDFTVEATVERGGVTYRVVINLCYTVTGAQNNDGLEKAVAAMLFKVYGEDQAKRRQLADQVVSSIVSANPRVYDKLNELTRLGGPPVADILSELVTKGKGCVRFYGGPMDGQVVLVPNWPPERTMLAPLHRPGRLDVRPVWPEDNARRAAERPEFMYAEYEFDGRAYIFTGETNDS